MGLTTKPEREWRPTRWERQCGEYTLVTQAGGGLWQWSVLVCEHNAWGDGDLQNVVGVGFCAREEEARRASELCADAKRPAVKLKHARFSEPEIVQTHHPHAVELICIECSPDDETLFDLKIMWVALTDHGPTHPRLSMFNDAWGAMRAVPELFDGLVELGADATVDRVAALLVELGSEDTSGHP